jgi:uncharacterized protein
MAANTNKTIKNFNPAMDYRRFGKTEETLSVITLGGMRFPHVWDEPREEIPKDTLESAIKTVEMAMAAGINHIESAHGYMKSETVYGMAFEQLNIRRDSYYLMTKSAPKDASEMRQRVEEQLTALKTDYFDFYAIHGINNQEVLDKTIGKGKALEELYKLKDEGLIKHIGFSTHGQVELICKAINTDMFDFVNLHYYYFFQRNQAAVDLAELKDMGVFIISPNDKGGQLFNPSPKLTKLTKPLHPMTFNARWCLKTPSVHTLSFGMTQKEHFKSMKNIFPTTWPMQKQERIIEQKLNKQYLLDPAQGYQGYDLQNDPSGMNIPEYLRLLRMAKCFDLYEFGKYRYNSFSPDDHWVQGAPATEENIANMDESRIPPNINVKALLREAHQLFYQEKEE